MTELRTYLTVDQRAPFDEWLAPLRDVQARARIRARLARVQAGKSVTSSRCRMACKNCESTMGLGTGCI